MSAIDVARALRVPGRLSFGPSDLTTAWPHGGTGLGFAAQIRVEYRPTAAEVTGEEFDGGVVALLQGREDLRIFASLRDADNDAIAQCFLNSAAGSVSQHRVWQVGGTNIGGYDWAARAVVLVFTPDAADVHPMVLMKNAVPMVAPEMTAELSIGQPYRNALQFVGLPDTDGVLGYVGRRKDLTL